MLQDILARVPVSSIGDVVATMTAIDRRLPDSDGLKWFNRLYLRVTEQVRDAVARGTFADPGFMTALDVVFANQYFEAIRQSQADLAKVPSAWRPVLAARRKPGITRLQFALAGMNAHINRDLPAGIVRAFEIVGGDPLNGQARRDDFDRVNGVLEALEADVKPEFSVGLVGAVDVLAGQADDLLAMWNVRAARATAWTNGQVLWSLRAIPPLQSAFFERLDSFAGFAGRGLLVPTLAGMLDRRA